MPLTGKRAIIINKFMSTTLNNDKQDSKTFLCNIFKVILRYLKVKSSHFHRNTSIMLNLRGIEPAILWSRDSNKQVL